MFELVISLYQDSNQKRHQELISCLKKNLKLNCIKKIHLLLEGEVLDIPKNKKIITSRIKNRPTYNDFFDYCNKKIKGNAIIANADISFDKTLKKISNKLTYDHFIFISRHESEQEGLIEIPNIYGRYSKTYENIFSHDAWIFKSPMKYRADVDVTVGTFFCDGLIIYFLHNHTDYNLYNLSHDIKIIHNHNTSIPDSVLRAKDQKYIQDRYNFLMDKFNFPDHNFVGGIRVSKISNLNTQYLSNNVWMHYTTYYDILENLHGKRFISLKTGTVA